ncbi:MAG TPA: hypothetical protein VF710_10820 [Longimicrobium sp.]
MRTNHNGGLQLSLLALLLLAGCGGPPDGVTAPPAGVQPVSYTPGQSYFGRNRYVEYIAGNAPVILSAPHGGDLTPDEIPDRTAESCGGTATIGRDLNTRELVVAMQRRYFARFGSYPHVVVNHLHRSKLDANRDLLEAACGDAEAGVAWREFHDFLTTARSAVVRTGGRGWYMDMHGHGHPIQRLELGYLLRDDQLDLSDARLDAYRAYEDTSSIRTISAQATRLSFSALLRGAASLGTLYTSRGFPAVPSSTHPSPAEGEAYFSGGYNTARHTCGAEAGPLGGAARGAICGVQIEANYTGVRDTQANMDRFGDVTAEVLDSYLTLHWGLDLDAVR